VKPFVVLLCLIALRVWDPWPVESIRLRVFDALLRSVESRDAEYVAVHDIDEAALAEHGQWPWPRDQLATLNRQLLNDGAAAVVYTVLFPEVDRFGGDTAFAESMLEMPVFLSAVATNQTQRVEGYDIGVSMIGPVLDSVPTYSGILPNTDVLQRTAFGTGVVNSAPEVDGLVRRVPMLVRVGDALYPALALDVLRGMAGDPSYQAKADDAGMQSVRVPQFSTVETDALGRVFLDWSTRLDDQVQGKIVFVGVTASGVSPLVPTPIGAMHAHRIQARLFETLAAGTNPTRPAWSIVAEILSIAGFGLLVVVCARFLPVPYVVGSLLLISAVSASGALYAFGAYKWLMDGSFLVLSTLITGGVGIGQRMLVEFRLKLQIKKQFSTYLDPRQVRRLQNNPDLLTLGGERKRVTVLFTDVRGFTTISEQHDAAVVHRLMSEALSAQVDAIHQAGGMVDKFIGDAAMAIFNAPLDLDGHEQAAIDCAQQMLVNLEVVNKQLNAEGLPTLKIGIGINTAEVLIGNLGSTQRFDYTAIGDGVNVAARFESATKEAGVDILIGEETAQHCQTELESLPAMSLKGKAKKVQVYTIKGAT